MKRAPLALLMPLAVLASTHLAAARDCQYEKGEARWSIKTSLASAGAAPSGIEVDLGSLIALDNPDLSTEQIAALKDNRWDGSVTAKDASGNDVALHEGDVVAVAGYAYRARCQKDGDYHIEIGVGPSRKSPCMIVEAPDPREIADEALRGQIVAARDSLEQLDPSVFQGHPTKNPIPVRVTGQLFLDETHHETSDPGGGRGSLLDSGRHCASNLWEIHPVTGLE